MKGLFAIVLSAGAVAAERPGWKHFDHDLCPSGLEAPFPVGEMEFAHPAPSVHYPTVDPESNGPHCSHKYKSTAAETDFQEWGTLQECFFDVESSGSCECDGDICVHADYDGENPICSQEQALAYLGVSALDLDVDWEDMDDNSDGVQLDEIWVERDLQSLGSGEDVYRDGGCRRINVGSVDSPPGAGVCEGYFNLANTGMLTQCVPHKKWGWCHSGESCVFPDNDWSEECMEDATSDGGCASLDETDCETASEVVEGQATNCMWKVKPPNKGKGMGNGNRDKCVPQWPCAPGQAPA